MKFVINACNFATVLHRVPEFHAEAPQAPASEGLIQSPYVAARAGFERTTLGTKGAESINETPCPTDINCTFWPLGLLVSACCYIRLILVRDTTCVCI